MKKTAEQFAMEYLERQLEDIIRKVEIQKIQSHRAHDAFDRLSELDKKASIDETELQQIDTILSSMDRRKSPRRKSPQS